MASQSPKTTAKIPTPMLDNIYRAKLRSSPLRNKWCFSKAKAEKVVKPPQKPVAKKRAPLDEKRLPLVVRPRTKPISKQPIILTMKVPKKKF